jgi:hypothetical protein
MSKTLTSTALSSGEFFGAQMRAASDLGRAELRLELLEELLESGRTPAEMLAETGEAVAAARAEYERLRRLVRVWSKDRDGFVYEEAS